MQHVVGGNPPELTPLSASCVKRDSICVADQLAKVSVPGPQPTPPPPPPPTTLGKIFFLPSIWFNCSPLGLLQHLAVISPHLPSEYYYSSLISPYISRQQSPGLAQAAGFFSFSFFLKGMGGLGWVVWTRRLGPGPFNNKSLAKYFCPFVSRYMYFNVLLRLLCSLTAHSLAFYLTRYHVHCPLTPCHSHGFRTTGSHPFSQQVYAF